MPTDNPQKSSGRDTAIHLLRYGLPVFAVMAAIFAVSQMSADTITDSAASDSASSLFGQYTDEVAHFVEYFVLSGLVMRWILAGNAPNTSATFDPAMLRSAGQKAVLISVLYGISDEAHQWFIDGRSVQFLDILIDSAGAVMGSAVYLSVFQAWRLQRSRSVQ
jgi:VanZ family protein